MNDIDSSLTNTNDPILIHILLFGQGSLNISGTTHILNTHILNAAMKYINEQISRKSFFSIL